MLLPLISCSQLILPACLFICTSVRSHEPLACSPSSASHPLSELGQSLTLLNLLCGSPHASILQSFLHFVTFSDCFKHTGTGSHRNHSELKSKWKPVSFLWLPQWHTGNMVSPRPLTWKAWIRVCNCYCKWALWGQVCQTYSSSFAVFFSVWRCSLNECASCTVISLTFK